LREAKDEIESEGIRRSRVSLERAELILHVLDASEPLHTEDEKLFVEFANKKRIVIRNKMDLPHQLEFKSEIRNSKSEIVPVVDLCTKTGAGLDQLKDVIKSLVWSGSVTAEMAQVTINSRHQDALKRASGSLRLALDALRGDASLEFVALDLRQGIAAVGEIVGKTTTEDLLDAVFSQFCIGK
jgi:tRNA modification GTPase